MTDVERTVTVVGHGAAQTVPDVMHVDLGVECHAYSVGVSLQDAGAAVADLIATLTDAGVPSRDIQTSHLSVQPRYGDHGPNGAPIIGYTSSHTMTVVLRDLERVPTVLAAAARAGGDAARIQNVSFAISDDTGLAAAARDAAFADAVSRAEQYAMLAGARLGAVQSVTEEPASDVRPLYSARAMAAPMPIQAGSSSVTASVTVVFYLDD
ncbi:SIMPL domain-containing protein [Gordonia malaquae]|uniref:SIMPL domain-containing protein n=1 Tax=Gordonia TaxID=2053 RepID=UPI003016768A